jgi:hypothetical protein
MESNQEPQRQVVVVGPDGRPLGQVTAEDAQVPDGDDGGLADLIEQPAKVMRIGSMIKQLLDEVKEAPLDEAARARLREIHARSVAELESGLAPELVAELDRLSLPFTEDTVPSEAELRIAQAQLVGWLEGLFHGIQTALFAQQMAARAAFEEMRRRAIAGGPAGGLPGGIPAPDPEPGAGRGHQELPPRRSSGPYL